MLYSLDTNAVIALMSGKPAGVRERVGDLVPDDAGISTIVLHELLWGAYKSEQVERNLQRIALLRMTEIAFDPEDARAAAEIRAALRRKGTPIGPYDLLIAGQAKARGLTVITANVREFERVEGLKVEDWTAGA
jgi:tRNA(fMet)-specific endonuclease VapC